MGARAGLGREVGGGWLVAREEGERERRRFVGLFQRLAPLATIDRPRYGLKSMKLPEGEEVSPRRALGRLGLDPPLKRWATKSKA